MAPTLTARLRALEPAWLGFCRMPMMQPAAPVHHGAHCAQRRHVQDV